MNRSSHRQTRRTEVCAPPHCAPARMYTGHRRRTPFEIGASASPKEKRATVFAPAHCSTTAEKRPSIEAPKTGSFSLISEGRKSHPVEAKNEAGETGMARRAREDIRSANASVPSAELSSCNLQRYFPEWRLFSRETSGKTSSTTRRGLSVEKDLHRAKESWLARLESAQKLWMGCMCMWCWRR